MSAESDIAIIGKAIDEERKRRHLVWWHWNMRTLDRKMCGRFSVTNHGETVLFREKGYPKVDFYPSTGRWRSQNKTYSGQAAAFLVWYERQGQKC